MWRIKLIKKFFIKIAVSFAMTAVLAVNGVFGSGLTSAEAAVSEKREAELRKELASIVSTIDVMYYTSADTEKMLSELMKEIDDDTSYDDAAKKLVAKLNDRYSEFMTVEEFNSFNNGMRGEYYGIGVEVSKDETTKGIKIVRVFEGSPAEKAKLKAGDIILKVGSKDVTKLELSEVVSYVKGEKGTKVTLTILRGKTKKKYKVERDEVVIPSVRTTLYEKNSIAHIQVSAFLENTDEEFAAELDKLNKKTVKGVVLDFRNNGGGYVDTAYNMLNRVLPSGKKIFSYEHRSGLVENIVTEDAANTADKKVEIPTVILINNNSASASEIFTGAMRDIKGVKTVGEKTFGKGVAQSIYTVFDEATGEEKGGLKLTVVKYYLPKGSNIDKTGITPDYKIKDKTSTEKDEQFEKALSVLKKLLK